VIRKKGFTFAPRKLRDWFGKVQKDCVGKNFQKNTNFYLVIKKKGFRFAPA
jgi:hypothetical protein